GQEARVSAGGGGYRREVEPAGPPSWEQERVRYVDREEPVAIALHDVSYVPGDRVRHARFGEGIVVSSVLAHGDEEVTVAFQGIGVKKLALSFAPLERL